jgi:hypothetical protein
MTHPGKHVFSALIWHFGQYGPQDCHVHSCIEGGEDDADRCDVILISIGRECNRDYEHSQATLGDNEGIERVLDAIRAAEMPIEEAYPFGIPRVSRTADGHYKVTNVRW